MNWPWTKEKVFKQIDVMNNVAELDENSPTWKFIEKFIEKEIAVLQLRNESLKIDNIKTAFIRGEISAFRKMAKLPTTIGRGNTP